MNFQDWLQKKKLSKDDMVFTKALKTIEQNQAFIQVADQMAKLQPSQSSGLQFLELATDLILMNKLDDTSQITSDFDTWIESLRKLRYPQAYLRDEELKLKIQSLSWPAGSKIKFERRGDKSGVELRFFISSPSDLDKLIGSLERIKKEFPG